MAKMEVSEFSFTHSSNASNYIDLTKTDTLANCKGKYQFKRGRPLAYVFSARFSDPGNSLETIPTGWMQTNALTKTAAAWNKMNKKAGISRRDLNTYGKEPRFAFDAIHKSNYAEDGWELVADGLPDEYTATGEYDENGDAITVFTIGPAVLPTNYVQAFDHTVLTVPSPDGSAADEIDWSPYVIGSGQDSILSQYVLSRGTVDFEDEDMAATELFDGNNRLRLMMSDNEESSDDVVDNVKDYGDYRPYELATMVSYTTQAIVAGANVAGQDTTCVAPLGLLKWNGENGDKLFLRLEAIIEL